jgi:hypothetical protein
MSQQQAISGFLVPYFLWHAIRKLTRGDNCSL